MSLTLASCVRAHTSPTQLPRDVSPQPSATPLESGQPHAAPEDSRPLLRCQQNLCELRFGDVGRPLSRASEVSRFCKEALCPSNHGALTDAGAQRLSHLRSEIAADPALSNYVCEDCSEGFIYRVSVYDGDRKQVFDYAPDAAIDHALPASLSPLTEVVRALSHSLIECRSSADVEVARDCIK